MMTMMMTMTTTTAINDGDRHPLVAVTSANMKEMIPTASQLFQAFDKEKMTTTASHVEGHEVHCSPSNAAAPT